MILCGVGNKKDSMVGSGVEVGQESKGSRVGRMERREYWERQLDLGGITGIDTFTIEIPWNL